MIRTLAIRPAAVTTLASALLFTALGGMLSAPGADAAQAKPAPVRAVLATKLSEAGGSKVAIRLAKPAPATVKLLVQTRAVGGANAAAAPADFVARSQWVTIKQGAKVGWFVPKVVDDAADEPDERLQVRIVKSTRWAKLPAAKHRAAFATIVDNDAPAANPKPAEGSQGDPSNTVPKADPQPKPAGPVPSLSVSNAPAIFEGEDGKEVARFTATLDAPYTLPVDAPYAMVDGSAVAGVDFAATAGTLTFAPGVTQLHVDVPVLDDDIDEDEETAKLQLGTPTNATVAAGSGTLTIMDDEGAPSVGIANVSLDEGDAQNTTFPFQAKLSHPSSKVVTMTTYTLALNATGGVNCFIPGVDYVSFGSKVVTFQPGETVKELPVKVCGDDTFEQHEYFALPVTKPTNAVMGNAQGMGMIQDDDQ